MPRRSPMLKSLRSAEPSEILEAIAPLTEEQRIQLALYCYNRSHVREWRLRVAETIDAARSPPARSYLGQRVLSGYRPLNCPSITSCAPQGGADIRAEVVQDRASVADVPVAHGWL